MTILIPALNAERWIVRALSSVLNQSRDDWDIQLLVDAATSDKTWKKAKKFAANTQRSRSIHINISEAPGLPCVYKEMIDRAEPKDDVCGILDSDDRLLPRAVEAVMGCYESKPSLGCVWTQFGVDPNLVGGWSRPLPKGKGLRGAFLSSWWGAQHWRTFRKSTYTKSPYRLQMDVPYATDYNLALVLAATDCPAYFCKQTQYVYYMTPGSITRSKHAKQKANFRGMLHRFRVWNNKRLKKCVS